jgi:hypothetical protein
MMLKVNHQRSGAGLMTAHIMVSLDGSEQDGRALAVASAMARLSSAGIHLVETGDRSCE